MQPLGGAADIREKWLACVSAQIILDYVLSQDSQHVNCLSHFQCACNCLSPCSETPPRDQQLVSYWMTHSLLYIRRTLQRDGSIRDRARTSLSLLQNQSPPTRYTYIHLNTSLHIIQNYVGHQVYIYQWHTFVGPFSVPSAPWTLSSFTTSLSDHPPSSLSLWNVSYINHVTRVFTLYVYKQNVRNNWSQRSYTIQEIGNMIMIEKISLIQPVKHTSIATSRDALTHTDIWHVWCNYSLLSVQL